MALYDRIPHIYQPEVRSTILNWFSRNDVSRDEKEAFINALINFDDRCSNFFSYQTYFLAAEAIAYFPECLQADAIIDRLLKWSYSFCQTSKEDWKIYPKALKTAARETLKRTDIQRVANRLSEIVHTTDSLIVLRLAAEELGKLDSEDESAISALEQLVQYPQPLWSCFKAIATLLKIDPENSVAIAALIKIAGSELRLSNLSNWYLIRDVIWMFREVKSEHETIIATVAEFIQTWLAHLDTSELREKIFLCSHAAVTLGLIDANNEIATSTLIDMIQHSRLYQEEFYPSEQFFGWEAVEALGRVADGNSTVIAKLTQMLADSQESLLRCHIAAALLRIDRNNPKAIAILSEILEVTQIEVRLSELETLTQFRASLPEYLLWRSADSLARNDPNCQSAIDVLIQLVQTSISDTPCLPVLSSLFEIDNQLAICALIRLLDTQPDGFLCENLWLFRNVEVGNELVINALTRLIQISQSRTNRYVAAGALGIVDPGNSLAIATLIELLDSDYWSLWSIAQQLGEIGINHEQGIAALIRFVQAFKKVSDQRDHQRLTDCFKHLKSRDLCAKVIQELKSFLEPQRNQLNNDEDDASAMDNWADIEGVRAEVAYQIIWNCAQNMSYPDFYQAWNGG